MKYLRQMTIRNRLLLILVATLSALIVVQIIALSNLYTSINHSKEDSVRLQAETAHSLVNHFYQLAQSGMPETEAKTLAMNAVKQLRYNGSEYFWINDTKPVMIMHPINPKLDNQPLNNIKDPNGLYLFMEMVKVVRNNPDGGFVPYFWPKPGSANPVSKVS